MSIELIDQIVSPYEELLKQKGYTDLPGSLKRNNIISDLRYRIVCHFDFPEPKLPEENDSEKMGISTKGIFGRDSVVFAFNFELNLSNPYNYLDLKSIDVSINSQESVNIPLKHYNDLPDAEQVFQLVKIHHFQSKVADQNMLNCKRSFRN